MDLVPPVVWVTGYSGSGKTTLIEQLLAQLPDLAVATAKHHHRMRHLDRPGTDTDRHARAGAAATLLAGPAGAALFLPGPPPPLRQLLVHLPRTDLVLVEGFTRQATLAIRLRDAANRLRPLPRRCRALATLQLAPARPGRRPRFAAAAVKALAAQLRALAET